MNTSTKLTIFASLTAMLLGTAALAAGGDARHGPRGAPIVFSELDADGDGLVTQAELDAHREARFADVDTDGDGAISLEEFTEHAAMRSSERAAQMFARLDADGDGVLSRDVLEARGGRGPGAGAMIERLDADGDGAVSEEEFAAMKERFGERRGPRGGHRNN